MLIKQHSRGESAGTPDETLEIEEFSFMKYSLDIREASSVADFNLKVSTF